MFKGLDRVSGLERPMGTSKCKFSVKFLEKSFSVLESASLPRFKPPLFQWLNTMLLPDISETIFRNPKIDHNAWFCTCTS